MKWLVAFLCLLGCGHPTQPVQNVQTVQGAQIGPRAVALLLFRNTPEPRPASEYIQMLNDNHSALELWSLGQSGISGRVFGWFYSEDLSNKTTLINIAKAGGYNPSAFHITGFVLTGFSNGVAVLGNGTGDFTVGASEGSGTILHEILHVCGLGHAKKLLPDGGVNDYGDRYSIMGSDIFGEILDKYPTAMHREMLGWGFPRDVEPAYGGTKEYPIDLYETTGDAIRIPRGAGDYWYIERRRTGIHICSIPKDRKSTLWNPIVWGMEGTASGVRISWPDSVGPVRVPQRVAMR